METKDAMKCLRKYTEGFGKDVAQVCNFLLDNPKFALWSGSSKDYQHHYGEGGLANHTYEVVRLCFSVTANLPQYDVDGKELFMAALFHDAGKLYDYFPTVPDSYCYWGSTLHKRYIHHITRSALMWAKAAEINGLIYERYHDKVLHAILAHHGEREYGSPVAPKSRVAWLVHYCDGLSARMYDADTLDIIKRKT